MEQLQTASTVTNVLCVRYMQATSFCTRARVGIHTARTYTLVYACTLGGMVRFTWASHREFSPTAVLNFLQCYNIVQCITTLPTILDALCATTLYRRTTHEKETIQNTASNNRLEKYTRPLTRPQRSYH